MDLEQLLAKVPSDLELAVLLGLIARQPCLIYGDDSALNSLASELALIVSDKFKLSYAVLEPSDLQSVDTFVDAILDDAHHFADASDVDNSDSEAATANLKSRLANVSFRGGARSHLEHPTLDNRMVVNVIIAKQFNHASYDVQIQVMDLIRKHRVFSKTTVHPVPKLFLFLPIISTSSTHIRINPQLNDRIFISHRHNPSDGFPNVEDMEMDSSDPFRTASSLSRSHSSTQHPITKSTLDHLAQLAKQVTITPSVRRHLQDIVVFLRMERGVDSGITPYSNVCFVDLAKLLAPLHGIDFVTPSLLELAAKKVFPHRLIIAEPERERSTQFGSDIGAVRQYLWGLEPEHVIDAVLAKVPTPR
jgi:hypothetical protein